MNERPPEWPPPEDDASRPRGRVGPVLAVVLFLVFSVVGQFLMAFVLPGIALALIGVTQLLYVIPLNLALQESENAAAAKIVAILAGVVLLANGLCAAVVANSGVM